MVDRRTLAAYQTWATAYRRKGDGKGADMQLAAFIQGLPPGARVMDLGCGPGRSAALMMEAGLEVEALDASPALAEIASDAYGVDVRVASFDVLNAVNRYDGIFANFSLLHVPKSEMPGHLNRIRTSLKPDGLFHIGLKIGEGEARDGLDRLYSYYSDQEITAMLQDKGFVVLNRWFGSDEGLDGILAPWIVLHARRET